MNSNCKVDYVRVVFFSSSIFGKVAGSNGTRFTKSRFAMECKAQYSILGSDNVFANIGINPCLINALEIVIAACVFGVLIFAVRHATSTIVTWYRWLNLTISTRRYNDMDSAEPSHAAIGTTGSEG